MKIYILIVLLVVLYACVSDIVRSIKTYCLYLEKGYKYNNDKKSISDFLYGNIVVVILGVATTIAIIFLYFI